MGYYINKIVGWILSPLGILFIGLGIGWVMRIYAARLAKMGRPCARRFAIAASWLTGLTIAFTWVISCGITTRIVGVGLEKDWEVAGRPHGDISGLPNADAIVVLGGGMGAHPECGAPEMFGSADRAWQGARLYKAGLAKVVSLSGPDVEKSTIPLMEDLGVPREAFLYFPDARNTEEESRLVFAALSKNGAESKPKILLVTSAWHMTRAKLLFERVGFEVIPAPTDFEMSYVLEYPIQISDFFPFPEVMTRNSYALKEWVANVGYRLLRR